LIDYYSSFLRIFFYTLNPGGVDTIE